MLKSHKILLAAFVLFAVTLGTAGQKSAEARTIACGPTTTVYRPTVCRTPVYSPTHYVCYYDPSCCRWITRWYKNYYDAVAACNYLRCNGYRFNTWTR